MPARPRTWIDRIANLKHGRRKGVNFARRWAAMRRHRGNRANMKRGRGIAMCLSASRQPSPFLEGNCVCV